MSVPGRLLVEGLVDGLAVSFLGSVLTWRLAGRVLCAAAIGALHVRELEPCDAVDGLVPPSARPGVVVALGLLCGASFKVFDLWAEHGLRSRLALALAVLGSTSFLPLFVLEPSWVAAEIVFHGIVRGKCDNPLHWTMGMALLGGLLHLPLCAALDWPAIALYIAAGWAYNAANKRWRWGDTYANQFRVDKFVMLPLRPMFFAVAYAEQCGYALTKIAASSFVWYKE